MDKINVFIIENTPTESDALVKMLTSNNFKVVGVASTYKEALTLFCNCEIDIVLIDVFLNGNPEGIAFAETMNVLTNKSKPFLFLSSSLERQIFERARLTHPFGFLSKPFNEMEILYALERVVEKFYTETKVFLNEDKSSFISDRYLFVKKNKSLKKVLIDDIVYIEVDKRYCNIVTENDKFVILMSLTKILNLLNPAKFSRTHRNYVINSEKIEEIMINDNLIVLKGKHIVTLGDTYKQILNKFLILN